MRVHTDAAARGLGHVFRRQWRHRDVAAIGDTTAAERERAQGLAVRAVAVARAGAERRHSATARRGGNVAGWLQRHVPEYRPAVTRPRLADRRATERGRAGSRDGRGCRYGRSASGGNYDGTRKETDVACATGGDVRQRDGDCRSHGDGRSSVEDARWLHVSVCIVRTCARWLSLVGIVVWPVV